MTLLYNIGIQLYYLLALSISPFNKKAKLWINGRKGVLNFLEKNIDPKAKNVWFHVSSLGEFEQGRPIMEAFRAKYPEYKIVLTFFSPSGYEIRKNYDGADYICYLPLDTPRNAKKFIQIVQPKLVFFVKYDFWFHFLKQAKLSGARQFLVSGIFREKQAFFKPYGKWYGQILSWFEYFFVQNNESVELLKTIGITNSIVAGDTRFDRVVEIAQNGQEINIAKLFTEGSTTIVCGSTWPADEEFLIRYLNHNSAAKLILAPHEINQAHINSIIDLLQVPYCLYSKANEEDVKQARVLIIDNIGMLSSLYKYGEIAYIGGGLGAGIHNTLEAAVYGIPVLFGPNYHKFKEAQELIDCKGAASFSTYQQLQEELDKLTSDTKYLTSAGNASSGYVTSMTGATKIIVNYLNN